MVYFCYLTPICSFPCCSQLQKPDYCIFTKIFVAKGGNLACKVHIFQKEKAWARTNAIFI